MVRPEHRRTILQKAAYMNNPLSVENFEFKSGKKKIERSGQEIITACHEVMTSIERQSPTMEFRLFKTYRRGEFFTPCLGYVNQHGVDDTNGATVYIRPGLRNYNQGFNPERKYSKLYIASGLLSHTAYKTDDDSYDEIEGSITSVREMRTLLSERLGGLRLKPRQHRCVLCDQLVVKPEGVGYVRCPTHGDNPPMWLAPDTNPPTAAQPALVKA